jgi:dTDP-4-amino-4,6-dideoxygalactose transaminase
MLAYSVLLRPRLFWIPNSLPFLKLGTTEFNPAFATDELHRFSLALLPQLLADLTEINEIRRANASAIREALAGNTNFEFPAPAANSFSTFVRLPVLASNPEVRERAVTHLRAAGIGASPFYPTAICDIPGIGPYMSEPDFHCQKAESISQRLFTLPVHPFVTSQDIEQMGRILRTVPNEGSLT